MSFLLLHGWQNRRPSGHWQHWLAGELSTAGREVGYPQLPAPDEPLLDVWLAELRTHLANRTGPERVVVAHSLSCLLWLHAAARDAISVQVDRVLLVAPPAPSVAASHREIAAFVPPEVTPAQLAAASRQTLLVAADDDPYCPGGAAAAYGTPLGLDTTILPGAGHLDMDAGYGPWPAVLDWCLTGDPFQPSPAPPR